MMKMKSVFTVLGTVGLISLSGFGQSQASEDYLNFDMVRSTSAENSQCLPYAEAKVMIQPGENAEIMTVKASGLPPETEFDFFVTQLPDFPFGLSWYQGDLETNSKGQAKAVFIGRFNEETFIVAPGIGAAPVVHDYEPFPDALENPATGPIHTYHLGLWFNSPKDALAAGCSDSVTPFNGEHNAGVQVLSTRNFDDQEGPLKALDP